MPIPLPYEISKHITDGAPSPNLSLKFYKWVDIYENDFNRFKKDTKKESHKHDFLDKLVKLSKEKDYQTALRNRIKHLSGIGNSFTLITISRLTFGTGYEHPFEIGFMFDWTTGLPVIQGSSLKGAARNAAEEVCYRGTNDEKMLLFSTDDTASVKRIIDEVFGIEDKTGRKKPEAGDIVFFPAYPCLDDRQKFLDLDVMTPHYQPYYSNPDKPEQYPPADWYSPVPLNFLTVPAGVKYCFRLACKKNLKDTEDQAILAAKRILTYALTEYGVGAKTNVFYGYFKDE